MSKISMSKKEYKRLLEFEVKIAIIAKMIHDKDYIDTGHIWQILESEVKNENI